MIKCPNCGSTAQIRLQKIEEQELNCYTIEVTRTYKCGCGEVLTTKEYKDGVDKSPIPCYNTDTNKKGIDNHEKV